MSTDDATAAGGPPPDGAGGPAQEHDAPGGAPGASSPEGEPTEEELRAAYEAELSRLTSTDVMAQAAVSLLNVGARRLAPAEAGGDAADQRRDLAQARDAIDAVRALLEILQRTIPQQLGPIRDALSQLQMAYAREMAGAAAERSAAASGSRAAGGEGEPAAQQGGPATEGERPPAAGGRPAADEQPAAGDRQRGPGPAEASGRLWVPGR